MGAAPQLKPQQPLHRIREVRRNEEISLRTLSRRLGISPREVREMEDPYYNMSVRELIRWANAMEIPVGELLMDDFYHHDVERDAAIVRAAKSAQWIVQHAPNNDIAVMGANLLEELDSIVVGVGSISPWQEVGQRRTGIELSRREENLIRLSDIGLDTTWKEEELGS